MTYDYLESLLLEDGVDKSRIEQYTFRYEIESKGVTCFNTKPLSKNNFHELGKCKKSNKIYLHLIIKTMTKSKRRKFWRIIIQKLQKLVKMLIHSIRNYLMKKKFIVIPFLL